MLFMKADFVIRRSGVKLDISNRLGCKSTWESGPETPSHNESGQRGRLKRGPGRR